MSPGRRQIACAVALGLGGAWCVADAADDKKPAKPLVELSREIAEEVERLRGWEFKHEVSTGVYSETELREYILKAFREEFGPEGLAPTQAFLRTIGLIPKDCELEKTVIDVLLNQVAGFYDPASRSFKMLERGGVSFGEMLDRVLIAHELTHALDDQHLDLDKVMKSQERTEDWALAIQSVVEGSATALMTRYNLELMQSGEFDMEELAEVARREMERGKVMLQAPRYFSSLVATYMCGMHFLAPPGGTPGIPENVGPRLKRAVEDPPQSTEQILHPEKYWTRATRDEPVRVDDRRVEAFIERDGWFIVHRDTVGELLCGVLTTDEGAELDLLLAATPTYWTNDAARGWGGDRFYLLAQGESREAAARELTAPRGMWVTAWDTPEDREEFVEDYEIERDIPGRRVIRVGKRVAVYLFGYDEAQAAPVSEWLTGSPLEFNQGAQRWSEQ